MRKIQDFAAGFFILCVAALTVISILGVWEFFGTDVIWKSFQTLGLVAIVSIIVIVAGRFIGNQQEVVPGALPPTSPGFKGIRNVTLGVLIISAALLALIGVLAIWEVIANREIVFKSLSSVAILTFSSIIIVMACLERENGNVWKRHGHQLSGGAVLSFILLAWVLAATMF